VSLQDTQILVCNVNCIVFLDSAIWKQSLLEMKLVCVIVGWIIFTVFTIGHYGTTWHFKATIVYLHKGTEGFKVMKFLEVCCFMLYFT